MVSLADHPIGAVNSMTLDTPAPMYMTVMLAVEGDYPSNESEFAEV